MGISAIEESLAGRSKCQKSCTSSNGRQVTQRPRKPRSTLLDVNCSWAQRARLLGKMSEVGFL